jgi:hypothetical protein
MDYDAVDAEVQELSYTLRDADAATVTAEVDRLRGLAGQIADETARRRALARIERLPQLIAGPPVGTSPQYERATQLVGAAHSAQGTPDDRIAFAERATAELTRLAGEAPPNEAGTILRMNSSLARLIEDLRAGNGSG